jgi:hypothetical protein
MKVNDVYVYRTTGGIMAIKSVTDLWIVLTCPYGLHKDLTMTRRGFLKAQEMGVFKFGWTAEEAKNWA